MVAWLSSFDARTASKWYCVKKSSRPRLIDGRFASTSDVAAFSVVDGFSCSSSQAARPICIRCVWLAVV